MKGGLLEYLIGRVLQSVAVLITVATLLFFVFRLMPGNPLTAFISPTFTVEQQEALMARFGLDRPLWEQYVLYLRNLAQGDLGTSFFYREPVTELLLNVLPNTVYLTLTSLLLAYVIGIFGGILLAWRRNTSVDIGGTVWTLMARSAPQFWVGMLLLAYFAFELQWLPSGGMSSAGIQFASEWEQLTSPDFWRHLVLPVLTMTTYLFGLPLLLMRGSMLDVLQEDFVTMSRMKGFSEWHVMLRHVARNALLPVVTAMALGVGYAMGGNVVIETVFSWPGVGRMLVRAVSASDYPLAQGAFLVIAAVMIFMNLVADLLYLFLDPRVSYREGGAGR